MLELAVTSGAETFDRMREPLSDRGIRARYVRPSGRIFPVTDRADLLDEFRGFDVGFVYPSRLMEGGVVDVLLNVPWVNDREAILTSRNKSSVLARLAAADVPVPESVVVSNPIDESELVAAFDRFDPPVVVKPNSTTRGVGVAKVHDVDSLLGIVDYLELVHEFPPTGDKSFVLQEFLPDARDFRVMVVSGEYAGAVERRVSDGERYGRWKHNVHRNATATGVDLPEDLTALAERVAEVFDVDFLGVDLLVTDERAVVSETNARPTIDEAEKYEPDFYDRFAELIRSRMR